MKEWKKPKKSKKKNIKNARDSSIIQNQIEIYHSSSCHVSLCITVMQLEIPLGVGLSIEKQIKPSVYNFTVRAE